MHAAPRRLAAALIFVVIWGLMTHGKYSVTGDEPHYLMVAESLRADGDVDLANNYAADAGARFGSAGLRPGPHALRTAAGRLLPVHDIGLPVLLTPVYTIAAALARIPDEALIRRMRMNRGLFAYALVSLTMLSLSVWAAVTTMRALEESGTPARTAALVVSIAWLSPPVISNAFLVFPEPVAMLVTAWTVRRARRRDERWSRPDWALMVALGVLPWLHRKFIVYAAALFVVMLWRRRQAIARLPIAARGAVAGAFVLPPVALAAWTWAQWGNFGGPLAMEKLPLSLPALAAGAAGTIVDRENGLLWWAPVYLLLPAAFWIRRSELWPWLLPAAALAIPNAAHYQWWGGFSPAGRFVVPLVPLFCLAGVALVRRPFRAFAIPLLALQAVLVGYAWQHPRQLWPQGDGENRVLAIVVEPLGRIYRFIPSLRTDSPDAWPHACVLLVAILLMNIAVVAASRTAGREPRAVP